MGADGIENNRNYSGCHTLTHYFPKQCPGKAASLRATTRPGRSQPPVPGRGVRWASRSGVAERFTRITTEMSIARHGAPGNSLESGGPARGRRRAPRDVPRRDRRRDGPGRTYCNGLSPSGIDPDTRIAVTQPNRCPQVSRELREGRRHSSHTGPATPPCRGRGRGRPAPRPPRGRQACGGLPPSPRPQTRHAGPAPEDGDGRTPPYGGSADSRRACAG